MKVERKDDGFKPIVITLQTQDEVDQLFAIAELSEVVGSGEGIDKLIFKALKDYANTATYTYDNESSYLIVRKV